uniref:Apple domain-containing protein n=1 Tax=Meloidogyne javanica TaxID=6303 RepID=A0A915N3G4_MELJA
MGKINRRKTSMPVFNYKNSNFISRETTNLTAQEEGFSENEQQQHQHVMTALPDLSDPCFRRYINSIIINAQPYERRSSISLVNCKIQCLRSQVGHYTCRSFVYDNINQVCDLFAHVGDLAPARLLRFRTRDYFEPTSAIHCFSSTFVSLTGTSFEHKQIQVPAATVPINLFEFNSLPTRGLGWPFTSTDTPTVVTFHFLRTNGFELFGEDHQKIILPNEQSCIQQCSQEENCNSLEFSVATGECVLSSETAVPLGNGQLRQKMGTDYLERVCVDLLLNG